MKRNVPFSAFAAGIERLVAPQWCPQSVAASGRDLPAYPVLNFIRYHLTIIIGRTICTIQGIGQIVLKLLGRRYIFSLRSGSVTPAAALFVLSFKYAPMNALYMKKRSRAGFKEQLRYPFPQYIEL